MSEIKTYEGRFTDGDGRYVILASRFNAFVVESLVGGAVDTLVRHGVDSGHIERVSVPGAWEMPIIAQRLAAKGGYDAIIALGVVIRGGTPHFDYVAGECAKGLSSVSIKHDLPVVFGVLTVDTIEQAIERAGAKAGNKGAEAALSAIEMVSLLKQL